MIGVRSSDRLAVGSSADGPGELVSGIEHCV